MTGADSQQRGIVRRRVSKTSVMNNTHDPGRLGPPAPTQEKEGACLRGRWVKGHCPWMGFPLFSAGHILHLPHTSPSPCLSGGPGLPPMTPSQDWRGGVSEETCAAKRGTENPRKGQMEVGEKESVPRALQC